MFSTYKKNANAHILNSVNNNCVKSTTKKSTFSINILFLFRLEIAVEPWMEGLFPALQKFLSVTSNTETHTDCDRLNKQETLENGHMEHINGESSSNVTNSQINGIENVNTNDIISAKLSELTCNGCSSDVLLPLTTTNENSAINQNSSKTLDSKSNSEGMSSSLSSQDESRNANHNDECNLTNECQPSLKSSVPPLSESSVSIPVLPAAYLKVEYQEDKSIVSNLSLRIKSNFI